MQFSGSESRTSPRRRASHDFRPEATGMDLEQALGLAKPPEDASGQDESASRSVTDRREAVFLFARFSLSIFVIGSHI
jgi:hypothetical protein